MENLYKNFIKLNIMSNLNFENIVGFKAVDKDGNEQNVTVDEMVDMVSTRMVMALSETSTFAAAAATGNDVYENELPTVTDAANVRVLQSSGDAAKMTMQSLASKLGELIGVDNTIIKNKNSRVTDFNKAVEAGVYQVNLTNNIPPEANGPTSVYGNGILIVFTSIEFICQIYIPLMYLNIDNIYIRERNSSDWFKWRKFNGTEL